MPNVSEALDHVWKSDREIQETDRFVVEVSEQEILKSLKMDSDVNHELAIPEWQVEINALQNTPDAVFLANIGHNGARTNVPWLHVTAEHLGHAIMVGGGSSLEILLHEIGERKKLGQTIFALNGAAHYLRDRHFEVDYQVIIDARPENVRFLEGLPAKRYLLSSQCHPSLFDFLIERGADVTMFHPPHPGLGEVLPKGRNVVMIGGEHTVGLTAIAAVTAMGFRMIHLYGYDSSDSDDGRSHAYAQDLTSGESKRLQIICAGRKFACSFAMFKQAEVFPRFAGMLADFGCTLTVHGDGLLPTVAREMTSAWPDNAACCDLSKVPASFDFVTWLVVAEMDRRRRGAPAPLLVAFVDGPEDGFRSGDVQNLPEKQQIMDKVMRPAMKLFGAVEDPNVVHGRQYHYWYRPITDGYRTGEDVPKCEPSLGDVTNTGFWLQQHDLLNPIVITLRETRYSPERNSNLPAWIEFAGRRRAEGHKVLFVRDTAKADEPLEDFTIYPLAARDLGTRAALYSLAKCNLIVANGPAELLQFSDWPFIEFKPPQIDPLRPISLGISWWQRFAGITPPECFPWHEKHQLTVWQRDTVENLEDAWLRWLKATEN